MVPLLILEFQNDICNNLNKIEALIFNFFWNKIKIKILRYDLS